MVRRVTGSVVQLMHGHQTFKGTSSKVNVFAFNTQNLAGIQSRCFPSSLLHAIGRATKAPASIDNFADHGHWYTARMEHSEGVLILLQVSNTMNGRPYSGAGVLLRLREEAPAISVNAKLPAHRESVYNILPAFVGNADVLTVEEATDLGATMTSAYVDNYLDDEEEFEECWEVQGLNQGKTPKPTVEKVTTVTGETKAVVVGSQPRRRIRVRRRHV